MTTWEAILCIIGLTAITVVTRGFFIIPDRELPLPDWLKEGLRYAPLAALVAVAVPEIVLKQGHLIDTWRDARLFAAAAGSAWFFWRRTLLGTIVSGSAVMLALRIGLGW
ncbi:putative membrane protein [Burkholderiales bacterium JOSHI_001]|nr:putative membrane protein [Burkholderiales bacterium JOSHI_001]